MEINFTVLIGQVLGTIAALIVIMILVKLLLSLLKAVAYLRQISMYQRIDAYRQLEQAGIAKSDQVHAEYKRILDHIEESP